MNQLEAHKSLRLYWFIFVALLVLTAVTVGIASFHLQFAAALVIALGVASLKGSLVAGYFMHLVGEKKVIFWLLGLTVVIFGLVLLLPELTIQGASNSSSVFPLWTPERSR